MTPQDKVKIRKLPTGVPGLDDILGGGLPECSFNIIAGAPGCGKTTMAHQFVFANATPERPALYFTVLGEPALKMLRCQQQYTFFDVAKFSSSVRFINLSQVLLEHGLTGILKEITKEVEAADPAIVVVDSFRTVVRNVLENEVQVQGFVQDLGLLLTSCQATTFLIGEYVESELRDNPIFTMADGLFWLYQEVERNSVIRKLQIMKLRGQASVPGMHTFRITEAGLQAFARTLGLTGRKERQPDAKRLSIGIPELDAMLGGAFRKAIVFFLGQKHQELVDRYYGYDKLTQEDLEEEWERSENLSKMDARFAPEQQPARPQPRKPVDLEKLAYESPKAY